MSDFAELNVFDERDDGICESGVMSSNDVEDDVFEDDDDDVCIANRAAESVCRCVMRGIIDGVDEMLCNERVDVANMKRLKVMYDMMIDVLEYYCVLGKVKDAFNTLCGDYGFIDADDMKVEDMKDVVVYPSWDEWSVQYGSHCVGWLNKLRSIVSSMYYRRVAE